MSTCSAYLNAKLLSAATPDAAASFWKKAQTCQLSLFMLKTEGFAPVRARPHLLQAAWLQASIRVWSGGVLTGLLIDVRPIGCN